MSQMMHRAAQRRENAKAIDNLLRAAAARDALQDSQERALSIDFPRTDWRDAALLALALLFAAITFASLGAL
jgi:hypothetical protein